MVDKSFNPQVVPYFLQLKIHVQVGYTSNCPANPFTGAAHAF